VQQMKPLRCVEILSRCVAPHLSGLRHPSDRVATGLACSTPVIERAGKWRWLCSRCDQAWLIRKQCCGGKSAQMSIFAGAD
jgi:hypothetical protein